MKYILIAITVFAFDQGHAQINWRETNNWRLYRISGSALFTISADSLSLVKSYPLQSDSIIGLLDSVHQMPTDAKPVWMGGYLATCFYNRKIRKILISDYGGFFYDQTSGSFFQLQAQKKDDWIEYIHGCLSSL